MRAIKQAGEPGFIEQHLLACRTPQGADLLGLTLSGKSRGSHSQRDELLEMLGFGITAAGLPRQDRFARDAKPLGQVRLRQAKLCAQRQDALAEGIVALPIQGPVHWRSPFRLIQPGAAPGSDEKCDVTCCPVTSPGISGILPFSKPDSKGTHFLSDRMTAQRQTPRRFRSEEPPTQAS